MTLLTATFLSALVSCNLGAIARLISPNKSVELKPIQSLVLASIFGLLYGSLFYAGASNFEVGVSTIMGFAAFSFISIYRYLDKPEKLLKLRYFK